MTQQITDVECNNAKMKEIASREKFTFHRINPPLEKRIKSLDNGEKTNLLSLIKSTDNYCNSIPLGDLVSRLLK